MTAETREDVKCIHTLISQLLINISIWTWMIISGNHCLSCDVAKHLAISFHLWHLKSPCLKKHIFYKICKGKLKKRIHSFFDGFMALINLCIIWKVQNRPDRPKIYFEASAAKISIPISSPGRNVDAGVEFKEDFLDCDPKHSLR